MKAKLNLLKPLLFSTLSVPASLRHTSEDFIVTPFAQVSLTLLWIIHQYTLHCVKCFIRPPVPLIVAHSFYITWNCLKMVECIFFSDHSVILCDCLGTGQSAVSAEQLHHSCQRLHTNSQVSTMFQLMHIMII